MPGVSQHVCHRGNNRTHVFADDDDRRMFLTLLQRCSSQQNVAVHGYVLMTTHYHAQVTPYEEHCVPRMMQNLGSQYVRYFNDRHARTGTLWEGRYQSSLILDERYWLTCLRYIERNPVAAGMIASPADYEWSSYGANGMGRENPILTPHGLYLRLGDTATVRNAEWAALCGQPPAERDVAAIRDALRRRCAIGTGRVKRAAVLAA